MSLLFSVIDNMYLSEALVYSFKVDLKGSNALLAASHFHTMSTAALILLWISICAVKFSFLALFKRLIKQQPIMIRYWWCVLIFNVLGMGYGIAVYIISCPHFGQQNIFQMCKSKTFCFCFFLTSAVSSEGYRTDAFLVQCVQEEGAARVVKYSIGHFSFDIVSDLFSKPNHLS